MKKSLKLIIGVEFIFFISTIEPRKNVLNLVKAFEDVKKTYNKELKLILAGGKGWKSEETFSYIDNSEFKEDIIIPGYIREEEKQYLYEKCKMFAYPSIYEGFGIPILEAMENGAIVLTSNISSIPEVGGDAVIYIDNPSDYMDISRGIKKILNFSDDERAIYIKKGYERARKFDWEECAGEILKILTE